MGKSREAAGIAVGLTIVIGCNITLVAFLVLAGFPSSEAMSPFLHWSLACLGITQMAHVPLYLLLTKLGYVNIQGGVVLGATITLMLNVFLCVLAVLLMPVPLP